MSDTTDLKRWVRWKLIDGKRPAGLPEKVPDHWHKAYAWFVPWGRWDVYGQVTTRPTNPRPPFKIPVWSQQLRAEPRVAAKLVKLGPYVPPVILLPSLGPIVPDGASILDMDCTHFTSGIGWPAFDAGWKAGKAVIAPEKIVVYDNTSSAQGGDAFYVRGVATEIEYWIGHITTVPKLNAVFLKGSKMTEISSDHPRPHVHLGVNTIPFTGEPLESHDDYTHGAPIIRYQLEEMLAA